jgi:ribosomal protein S18 acetylase RimI-like enzyme
MTHSRPSRARLRPFRPEDSADICRIYPTFFVDTAVHYGSSRITVAEADGRAIGIVMWGPSFEPAWFDPDVERWAEVHELHVHPEYQGQGIGTRLARAAIRQAREAGFPVLYVITDDSNGPARRVYEKNGFAEHNRIIRYKVRL